MSSNRVGRRTGVNAIALIGLLLGLAAASSLFSTGEAHESGPVLPHGLIVTRAVVEPGDLEPPAETTSRIPIPDLNKSLPKIELATTASPKSTFIVSYYGFPNAARLATQEAVDIWSSKLTSPVPIRIEAYWEPLDAGTLSASTPYDFLRNSPGAPKQGIYYPSALANRFARRDLAPSDPDMLVIVNSKGVKWYTGLDGKPPSGTYDLVTVALHEIAHGLGIADSGDVADAGALFAGPTIFDTLLYSKDGKQLTSLQAPSLELYQLFMSGDLYFDGTATRLAAGERPRVFAPVVMIYGSSLSHLDEAAYPDGDPDALLTPMFAKREVIHDPGPILMALLADLGWNAEVGPSLDTPVATAAPRVKRAFAVQVASDGRGLAPTNTPTPIAKSPMPASTTTAAPTPSLSSVALRKASWQIDADGYLWVLGEAVNTGTQAIGVVEVVFTLYAANGTRLGTGNGTTALLYIGPGEDAPFRGATSVPPAGVARVTVAVSGVEPPLYQPPPGLEVTITSKSLSAIGVLHVKGSVKNTSNLTLGFIIPYVAIYGTDGNMVGVDFQLIAPTSLAPGETGTFDWALDDPPANPTTLATRTWIFALKKLP